MTIQLGQIQITEAVILKEILQDTFILFAICITLSLELGNWLMVSTVILRTSEK